MRHLSAADKRGRKQTSKVGTLIKQSVSYYINNTGPQKHNPFCLSRGIAATFIYLLMKHGCIKYTLRMELENLIK